MSVRTIVVDGHGGGSKGKVSDIGQQIVSPYDYDLTESKALSVINTAYNFYLPKPQMQFVITGIIAKGNKTVSNVTDAIVPVYEASSIDTTTVDRVLLQMTIGRSELVPALPVNILVNEGKWINVKTTDVDIYCSIFGYYVPVI